MMHYYEIIIHNMCVTLKAVIKRKYILFSLPKTLEKNLLYCIWFVTSQQVTCCAWKTNKIYMKYVRIWNKRFIMCNISIQTLSVPPRRQETNLFCLILWLSCECLVNILLHPWAKLAYMYNYLCVYICARERGSTCWLSISATILYLSLNRLFT